MEIINSNIEISSVEACNHVVYTLFLETENKEKAIAPFVEAAKLARKLGLGLNAGHDLSLENLKYFHTLIPWVDEVSIGHALISDALYFGLENTIKQYKDQLR